MPPQQFAIAAPTTEEMTKVVTVGLGAGLAGAVSGIVVKMAPSLGTLEPIFKWGTLLGIPAVGAVGALFTKGMISDFFLGTAAGGLGIMGYVLPEMLAPLTGRKAIGQNGAVKQLGSGASNAAARMQSAGARVGLEI